MTEYIFDGKQISIPGAYSTIKSGIKNPTLALAFGNTLIIDTGSGKFFGGGSGVNGQLKSGKDALYTFGDSKNFRNFIRGGLHWLLASPLFSPGGGATAGISSLTYVRAADTVPATISFGFGSGDSQASDDGTLVIEVNDEGYVGNGVLGNETRAKATITVTHIGSAGSTINVKVDGEDAGTYTCVGADSIATIVTGLAAAITANGLAEVFSTSATQIVIYAPHGAGDDLNGTSPTIAVTGVVTGSAGTFLGGVEGTILTRGYAAKMIVGVANPSKFIFNFYRGTFKGLDTAISSGAPFDAIAELSCKPELVAQSPEVDNVTDLLAWMTDDYTFNLYFTVLSSSIGTTDAITAHDLVAYTTYVKALGGTETFSISALADVLEAISDLTYDFIISDNWGDNVSSTSNQSINDWITNEANIKPDLYIGGGKDVSEWAESIADAESLDLQQNVLVHGGAKKKAVGGLTFKEYDSIYKAAAVLGRVAGLPPQVPPTFKNIGIDGELHILNKNEIKAGLTAGVLMTRPDGTGFEIIKGINTLQNNNFLINPDGTTHSIQLGRIERQINKELVFNAKISLLKKPNGSNRTTVSPEDVKTFTEDFLQKKVNEELILSFQAVTVTVNQDAYEITYAFTPNFEVSFLFFTGTVIDPATI